MSDKSRKPMRKNPPAGSDHSLHRDILGAQIRAIEGEGNERRFELSFSSEEPVDRWFGQEILDHSEAAVDLSRMTELGVVLFNHDANKVVGKVVDARIEGGKGKATIEFDDDDESEMIRKKVAGGTLKGVSVGYQVSNWEEVAAGKKSKDGRFTGPCYIATRWTPLEISIVSVPADATVGVGRSQEMLKQEGALALCERMVMVNENMLLAGQFESKGRGEKE